MIRKLNANSDVSPLVHGCSNQLEPLKCYFYKPVILGIRKVQHVQGVTLDITVILLWKGKVLHMSKELLSGSTTPLACLVHKVIIFKTLKTLNVLNFIYFTTITHGFKLATR